MKPFQKFFIHCALVASFAFAACGGLEPQLEVVDAEADYGESSSAMTVHCYGDLNYDGKVSPLDRSVIQKRTGLCLSCNKACHLADLNSDGEVNWWDEFVIVGLYNQCIPRLSRDKFGDLIGYDHNQDGVSDILDGLMELGIVNRTPRCVGDLDRNGDVQSWGIDRDALRALDGSICKRPAVRDLCDEATVRWERCRAADLNGDGGVDTSDLYVLVGLRNQCLRTVSLKASTPVKGDYNRDGRADIYDYILMLGLTR